MRGRERVEASHLLEWTRRYVMLNIARRGRPVIAILGAASVIDEAGYCRSLGDELGVLAGIPPLPLQHGPHHFFTSESIGHWPRGQLAMRGQEGPLAHAFRACRVPGRSRSSVLRVGLCRDARRRRETGVRHVPRTCADLFQRRISTCSGRLGARLRVSFRADFFGMGSFTGSRKACIGGV